MKDESICCPEFNPEPWDNKSFEWTNKKFISAKVNTFLYMPIGFGKAMERLTKLIDDAGANFEDALCISSTKSMWSMDLFLAVDKEISGAKNVSLSGKYFSKVYEGSYSETGKWMADFSKALAVKGYTQKALYSWYTTCPKCAVKYGKNYVVLISEI